MFKSKNETEKANKIFLMKASVIGIIIICLITYFFIL